MLRCLSSRRPRAPRLRSSRKDENECDAWSIGVPNDDDDLDDSFVSVRSLIDASLVRRSNDSLKRALALVQASSTAASSDPSDRGGLRPPPPPPRDVSESGESGSARAAVVFAGVASMMRIATSGDRLGLLHADGPGEWDRDESRALRNEAEERWLVCDALRR